MEMRVLYLASLFIGLAGIGVALAMMSVKSALDAWWNLAGIFSGGMLGLFLLGYLSKKVKAIPALIGVIAGVMVISWLTFSGQTVFHHYFTIVLGTITIFLTGFLLMFFQKKR
jgi:SSS family solute:Na+ symporter